MDKTKLQPSIDALSQEIARLVSARDTLQALVNDGAQPQSQPQKKTPTVSARSEGQRKRWAEQKRKQREAAKVSTAKKAGTK